MNQPARGTTVVEQEGQTLAAIVRGLLGVPWTKAKSLCVSGQVRVDGVRSVDPALRVPVGATVEVDATAQRVRPGAIAPEAIVHEDQDVIVVEKPAGLMTVPFTDEKDTLVDQVRAHLRRGGREKGRDPFVGVVQRLDKETTGVLVFARNMVAKRALEAQLREHTVHRRYLALAHGAVEAARYESWVVPDRGDGLRGSWGRWPSHRGRPPSNAKHCVTHARPLEALVGATLVECRLETGRQHQIRIHLSEAGHPLIGERVYIRDFQGKQTAASRPMLHAVELGFVHPRTGSDVGWRLAPPADFRKMHADLGGKQAL